MSAKVEDDLEGVLMVKVQLALHSSDGVQRCLITNEERTIRYETADKGIVEAMAGRVRVYFWAQLEGTFLHLRAEVEHQDLLDW